MLKPSTARPARVASVRNCASTSGMSSWITTVSIGTVPSLELHHMDDGMPLGKTTIIGGISPCAIAESNHEASWGMPAIGGPEPCSQ